MADHKANKRRPKQKGSKYPLTVYLDRELYDAVKQLAQEEGFSLSVITSRIIRDYIKRNVAKTELEIDKVESQAKGIAAKQEPIKEESIKEFPEEIRSSRFTFYFEL